MAEANLITVILTTNGKVNRACIESVLAQTVSDFELLIVGSKVEGLNDPRIKFVSSDENQNAARNIGLAHAVGEYVYFIDGDGMILDNALEVLIKAAAESGAEIIQSTALIEREGEDLSVAVDQKMLSLNLYRREFIEQAGLRFPESTDDPEPFMYLAECMAPTAAIIDDYFYVRTRQDAQQKKLRAEPEEYVKDIGHDEMRGGFLVTSQRKKLWNVQIKLILEFARVCRKHNLRWFAGYGTLLGAARHNGFIPWDDDVDLLMPRADYSKFMRLAGAELKSDYSLDVWYNYAWTGETNDENLPVLSQEVLDKVCPAGYWPVVSGFAKLRDNNTAMIQWPERRNLNQGIWIDIMPMDPVPPFDDRQRYVNFEIGKELLLAAGNPQVIVNAMNNHEQLLLPCDQLENILSRPFKQRALIFEEYIEKNDHETEFVSRLNRFYMYENNYKWRSTYFRDTAPLAFEGIEVPAPIDYEQLLTDHYGQWRKPVFQHSHVTAYSADLSYRDYFEQISPGIRVHVF